MCKIFEGGILMDRAKRENTAAIILSVFLAYLTYMFIRSELPLTLSDYNGHTYVYLPMFTGGDFIQGWKTVPYCIWHLGVLGMHYVLHIPMEISSAAMSIFFSLLSYYITYWMLLRYTAAGGKEMNAVKAALVAFGLSVLQPLYFAWLDAGGRFLGSYSMNPIHNPTQMSARPFALLCICLVYDIWNKQKDEAYKGTFFNMEKGLKKPYIYLAITLLLSTMTKPTFAEMFIPAVALIMLAEWIGRIRKKDGSASVYFKHCLNMLYCAIPGLLYILLAFLGYFIWGGSYGADGSFMITKWLEVWSMFTENVTLSMALGLAFPLFVILLDLRFFLKDNLGRLALVGYAVSFFEAALLGEGGGKLSHGDFMWPMMWGMALLFFAATLRLSVLEKTQGDTKVKSFLMDVAWFLFWLHVMFGVVYIKLSITF